MTRSTGRNGRDAIRICLEAVKHRAIKNGGRVTDEILLDAEEAVRREIGGIQVYINKNLPKETRHGMYRSDLADMSADKVARKHGVCVRTVETAGKTPTEFFGEEYSGVDGENG